MAEFVIGDVVILTFPFSDLSGSKKRPGLVIGIPDDRHLILAQITSKSYHDNLVILLEADCFIEGSLPVQSFIRPGKIFTASSELILYKAGSVITDIRQKVHLELLKICDYTRSKF